MAVVVNTGFQETAKLLTGVGSPTKFSHIALGTGSIAEGTTVSQLSAEISDSGLARAAASTAVASSNIASDTAVYSYTWTASGGKQVKECGVFNSSAAGKMLCYGTFAQAIPMDADDTLKVTWSVTVQAP